MPILESFQISHAHCAVWKIEEEVATLEAQLENDPFARPILDTMSHPAIQARFLAGRLAIQFIINTMGFAYQGTQRHANGQPMVHGFPLHCSISHTEGYAAAVVSQEGVVGVDLESPKEQLRTVATRFLTSEEVAWANDGLEHLTKLWVAKEAAYKLVCLEDVFLKSHFKMGQSDTERMMVLFQDDEKSEEVQVSFRQVDGHFLGIAEKG